MADIEAFIWPDEHGNIVAVGHVAPGCKRKIEPIAKTGQKVLKVRIEEEHLSTLHLTHSVDVARGTLYVRERRERTD